jgi:glycosyltransferase involved in cell wall biosynthesis
MMRGLSHWLPHWIICNSRATAECFADSSRVTVIPCGVETTLFHPSGRRGREAPRIGMVARFSPEKGQHLLLDAAERLGRVRTDVEYVFAGAAFFGEGRYEEQIRSRAQGGPLAERVRFTGFVEDVPSLLRDLDIIVHPSVEPEGFGQIVAEAMMAGKPVVVSAAGGSAELVEDGVTGRLVQAMRPPWPTRLPSFLLAPEKRQKWDAEPDKSPLDVTTSGRRPVPSKRCTRGCSPGLDRPNLRRDGRARLAQPGGAPIRRGAVASV